MRACFRRLRRCDVAGTAAQGPQQRKGMPRKAISSEWLPGRSPAVLKPEGEPIKCGMAGSDQLRPRRRSVRLDTLVRLRWLAVIGQSIAVLVVHYGLEYELPIWPCLAAIAFAALLNAGLRIRFGMTDRLAPNQTAWLLAFDIVQLSALLFLTGGLQNPFAFMLVAPVLLSATALPPRLTLML